MQHRVPAAGRIVVVAVVVSVAIGALATGGGALGGDGSIEGVHGEQIATSEAPAVGQTDPGATATNVTVGPDGDYQSISAALDSIDPDSVDAILVQTDTYEESVTVDVGVDLLAAEGAEPVVDASGQQNGISVGLTVEDVRIEGFRIENADGTGIVSQGDGIRIADNEVSDVGEAGIQITGSETTVTNNTVTNTGSYGITAGFGTGLTVENNDIEGTNDWGISVLGQNPVISGSEIIDADGGIEVAQDGGTVSDVVVENTGTGAGIHLTGSSATVDNATIKGAAPGIKIEDGDTTVRNSTIRNSTVGIEVGGTSGVTIDSNEVIGSGDVALNVTDSEGTEILDNDLGDMLVDGSTNTTVVEGAADPPSAATSRQIEVVNGSSGTEFENVDIGSGILSFSAADVVISGADAPPDNPEATSAERYFTAAPTSGAAFVDADLDYGTADGIDESTLRFWAYDGTEWIQQDGSSVDQDAGRVSGNVTPGKTVTVGAFGEEITGPFFEATIEGTASPVVEGETMTVDVGIENTGDANGTQTIGLVDGNGTVLDETNATLAVGERRTVQLAWDTGVGDDSEYDLTGRTENDTATTSVTVEPTPFAVTIDDTTSPVVAGESLDVTATVQNTHDANTVEQTIDLLSIGGAVVDTTTVELAPGEETAVTGTWNTSAEDAGDGEVTVRSETDTDTAPVVVEEPSAPASFEVTVDETTTPVVEGEDLTATATVENVGDQSGTQTVDFEAFDGTVVDSTEVTLDGGASQQVDLVWSTEVGDAGSGEVTVRSDNDTDTAAVDVLEATQEPNFDVVIDSVDASVIEGQYLNVTATVVNSGQESDTQSIGLAGIDGTTVDSTNVTLESGEEATVDLAWQTETGDAPGGDIAVSSEDDEAITSVEITEAYDVDLIVEDATAGAGTTVTVPIVIEDSPVADGERATIVDVKTKYDDELLTVKSTKGGDFGSTLINAEDGFINISASEGIGSSVETPIEVASITFQTAETPGEEATLDLLESSCQIIFSEGSNDENLDFESHNGNITIVEAKPDVGLGTPTIPTHVDANETVEATVPVVNEGTANATEVVTYRVDGEVVDQATASVPAGGETSVSLSYQSGDRAGEVHTVEVAGEKASQAVYVDIPDRPTGDVQGDGEVNAFDAIGIQREIVGLETDPGFDKRVADVDRSGSLSAFDVIGIQRIVVGLGIENQTIREEDVVLPEELARDGTAQVEVPVENPSAIGELDGLALELVDPETGDAVVVGATPVDLEPEGDTETYQFSVAPSASGLESGTYEVRTVGLVDADLGTIEVVDG